MEMLENILDGAANVGSAISTPIMLGTWLGACAMGAYEGYLTSKTGNVQGVPAASLAVGSYVSGIISSGCSEYEFTRNFEPEFALNAIGCFSLPAICYLGGLVAGKFM